MASSNDVSKGRAGCRGVLDSHSDHAYRLKQSPWYLVVPIFMNFFLKQQCSYPVDLSFAMGLKHGCALV